MTFLLGRRRATAPADVRLEAPARSFEFTFRRPTIVLGRAIAWRTVTRRYVVRGLPLRELLILSQRLAAASERLGGLSEASAVAHILDTTDALFFTADQTAAVWSWYCEVNKLGDPKDRAAQVAPPAAAAPYSTSSPDSSAGPSTLTGTASSA